MAIEHLLEIRVRLDSNRFNRDDIFGPAVLDIFERIAPAQIGFCPRLGIVGRRSEQRDVVLRHHTKPDSVTPHLIFGCDRAAPAVQETPLTTSEYGAFLEPRIMEHGAVRSRPAVQASPLDPLLIERLIEVGLDAANLGDPHRAWQRLHDRLGRSAFGARAR